MKTKDICKRYKSQMALDTVSIQINKGDIYGLVGENGAGKTTFLRAISGLIYTDSGEISLFSNLNFRNELHRVGFVIESPFLYTKNTATENLTIYCKAQNISLNRIPEVLELVGLSNCILRKHSDSKKKVSEFSQGMKQRLSLALALLSVPEFLVLDEPYNGLDPLGIEALNRLILDLNQKYGVTLLVSNHILKELEEYATKYGFIHQGKMIREYKSVEMDKSLMETYKELIGVDI
ncbi:MAG: ATP-binding cassette domain-containing protein [Oscillospiraceae bacterium]|nr:ATP-binding cassette domain-containing protein [Oscillospiraceae bacterium]